LSRGKEEGALASLVVHGGKGRNRHLASLERKGVEHPWGQKREGCLFLNREGGGSARDNLSTRVGEEGGDMIVLEGKEERASAQCPVRREGKGSRSHR